MKAKFLFAIIGFTLIRCVGYADPPTGVAVVTVSKPASTVAQISKPTTQQALKSAPRNSRNATWLARNGFIGGPPKPATVAPVITGAVNPGRNTAAVGGTGMTRKP